MANKKSLSVVKLSVLVVSVFAYLVFIWMYVSHYAYRYPFFANTDTTAVGFVIRLILPLVLLVLSGGFFLKKTGGYYVCIVVFYVVLLTCFIGSIGEVLYRPVVCSHTKDVTDFGQYDNDVSQMLEMNEIGQFPKEIPEYAKMVEYSYYYQKASSQTLYIAVSWSCDEKEYKKLVDDYSRYSVTEQNEDEIIYRFPNQKESDKTCLPWLVNNVIFQEQQRRVTFVLSDNGQDRGRFA